MAISFRGKQVDMVSLAKKYEKTVALGNGHMNGRGDLLGRGGKVTKTREEQLKEYYEGNKFEEKTVNLKEDSAKEVEKEITDFVKPKPRPKYEDITEEEKIELAKMKGK